MKRKPNYLKHLLQWGVLAAIAGTVLWAKLSDKPVDVEAYCPFGGLQAFGTYVVNNSLACSMSMLQIMMGLVLAVGVILFSKLFCGYLCPLGTVGEWMGRAGKKLHLQVDVPSGSIVDTFAAVTPPVMIFIIIFSSFFPAPESTLFFRFQSFSAFCHTLYLQYFIVIFCVTAPWESGEVPLPHQSRTSGSYSEPPDLLRLLQDYPLLPS